MHTPFVSLCLVVQVFDKSRGGLFSGDVGILPLPWVAGITTCFRTNFATRLLHDREGAHYRTIGLMNEPSSTARYCQTIHVRGIKRFPAGAEKVAQPIPAARAFVEGGGRPVPMRHDGTRKIASDKL